MKTIKSITKRYLTVVVGYALLLPAFSTLAGADSKDKVIVHIGSPQVWSLGQAHYFIAKMHQDNRKLGTKMPGVDDLDPNGINATKIQILRSLLDIEAQFDEKIGVENQAALREERVKLNQRAIAKSALEVKQKDLDALNNKIVENQKRLARLKVEDSVSDEARKATTPPTPPSKEDIARKQEIEELNVTIAADQAQQAKLQKEVGDLQTTANSTVTPTGLAEPPVGTAPGTLPGMSDFIKDRLKKVADNIGSPRLAASIVLDNFIAMQYEIIAKQLTLLRDEAGPYNRVIFLELPSSIYTAPCKSDDYIVQVQWKVSHLMDTEGAGLEGDQDDDKEQAEKDSRYIPQAQYKERKSRYEKIMKASNDEISKWRKSRTSLKPSPDDAAFSENRWKPAEEDVRALDIIPRQSALNVNEVQSTTSQRNFLGIFKLLSGLGIKVNYQRQKELYEQYLQQEVFASGFGKGLNTFGWTFGPLPGTNRIAPGVRTTYAILAVPQDTVLLGLEATAVAYRRKETPEYDTGKREYTEEKQFVARERFVVSIPNHQLEEFYVEDLRYIPAKRGEQVTMVISGKSFSPQMGVLIDGVALPKSISVGNTASSDAGADGPASGKVQGQFELVNSHELVLKFSKGPDYTGTPDITLVTPEKSSALNFFPLWINGHNPKVSLYNLSPKEPVFIDSLSLDGVTLLNQPTRDGFITALLKGKGMRQAASIWIGARSIPVPREPISDLWARIRDHPRDEFATQIDTGEYFLYIKPIFSDLTCLNDSIAPLKLKFWQKTVQSFETAEYIHKFPSDEAVTIANYSADWNRKVGILDLRILSKCGMPEVELSPANGTGTSRSGRTGTSRRAAGVPVTYEGDDQYRAVVKIPFEPQGKSFAEKTKISVMVTRNGQLKTKDLDIPVRPQIAKLTASPLPGNEDGALIAITGVNLRAVDQVLINDEKAQIIQVDNDTLVVKITKSVFAKQKGTAQIPVTLITKAGNKITMLVTVGTPDSDNDKQGTEKRARRTRRLNGSLIQQ